MDKDNNLADAGNCLSSIASWGGECAHFLLSRSFLDDQRSFTPCGGGDGRFS